MARLTKQQLRAMEQSNRRSTRQAERGLVGLALILIGLTWQLCVLSVKAVWWLFVTLPVLCFRLARKLTWRGWVVVGVLLAAGIVYGLFNSIH